MESFEITFFCKKDIYEGEIFSIIKEYAEKHNTSERKIVTDVFNEEDKDFLEIRESIFDLVLTMENYINVLGQLSVFVGEVFEKVPEIAFATGIYELTYYLTEHKNHLTEFDSEFLKKFPIVFLRSVNNQTHVQKIFENRYVVCVFNENAQVLY